MKTSSDTQNNSSSADEQYKKIKGSPSDRKKVILDRNLDLHKGKSTRNGKHMGKNKKTYYF